MKLKTLTSDIKMRVENTLILERTDLYKHSFDKNLSNIDLSDFMINQESVARNPIIMFIDNNLNTRILKNRYGNRGNVIRE